MKFTTIDMNTYPRKEHYDFYMRCSCTYGVTIPIDITELCTRIKELRLRTYPTLTWLLAEVVNCITEFRMALNEHGKLGYIDVLHPMCTTLNEQTKMFSCIWTEFSDSFENFYDNCVRNIEMFTNGSFTPQKDYPPNVFRISCTPWLDFTAFHIQVNDSNFLPFFTIGKFTERDGRTLMPLAIQVHHAVCDGYHVGQFVAKLSELITDCDKWLGTNGQRYN